MEKVKAPTWFMVVAILLILWDLMGVMAFTVQMMMTEEMLAALPEAERNLYLEFPMWTKVAYFIAVVGATIGSIGLVAKKKWAKPLFIVSLVAVIAQFGHSLFLSNSIEVYGAQAFVMPVLVVGIGIYQIILSNQAISKKWIN